MSEILKIFLTSSLTIFGGVIVYTVSQVILKFILEPIHEQKKVVADISDSLIFYANQFYLYKERNPQAEEVSNRIRSLSTQLKAKTALVPFYDFFEKQSIVIPKIDIQDACHALIGLSNSVYCKDGHSNHIESYRNTVASKLDIEIQ